MIDDLTTYHRRSMRLKEYDYSQAGSYFITICTQGRIPLFGKVTNANMQLNTIGEMIQKTWQEIPIFYAGIYVDHFVIMPNHIHGIIIVGAGPRACLFQEIQGQPQGVAPTKKLSLPDIIHRFKTMTTKRYIDQVKQSAWPPFPGKLWQRNYWERIIRNPTELDQIRTYIQNNPSQWELDALYL